MDQISDGRHFVKDRRRFPRTPGMRAYLKNFRRMCWHELQLAEARVAEVQSEYWSAASKWIETPTVESADKMTRFMLEKRDEEVKHHFAQYRLRCLDQLSVYLRRDLTVQPLLRREVEWNKQLLQEEKGVSRGQNNLHHLD